MKPDPMDPEVLTHPNHPDGAMGSLFDTWPTAAPATDEQEVLAVEGTIAERYARWRQTEDGEQVFQVIHRRARDLVLLGERRIGVKRLVEEARSTLRIKINNSFTAPLARELVRDALLADAIEVRVRRAT